jgi:hypothetical protein
MKMTDATCPFQAGSYRAKIWHVMKAYEDQPGHEMAEAVGKLSIQLGEFNNGDANAWLAWMLREHWAS